MLDQVNTRALVDAGYMPLSEYLRHFPEAAAADQSPASSSEFAREAYSVRVSTPWPRETFKAQAATKSPRRAA